MFTPPPPSALPWTFLGWDASDWATICGALGAGLLAALVAVSGYILQQRAARRDAHRTMYAEALRAVEDYLEAPYLVRRRDGSATSRQALVAHISAVQSRLNFYCVWLQMHAPAPVHPAYTAYVSAARREAGSQMTTEWRRGPTRHDNQVPLGTAYPRPLSDAARQEVLAKMSKRRWRR